MERRRGIGKKNMKIERRQGDSERERDKERERQREKDKEDTNQYGKKKRKNII